MDWFDKIKINDVTHSISVNTGRVDGFLEMEIQIEVFGQVFYLSTKVKKYFLHAILDQLHFYKVLGKKYGPIDLGFGNIGAYNFFPIIP